MKKITKQKLIRFGKGSISIMLCLVITPFLALAASLVEFHRYQTAAATLQELIDTSSMSALSDYDQYLLDRFGLLTISQGSDPDAVFRDLMKENIKITGNTFTPFSIFSGTPGNQLIQPDNYDVLRKQITDFSEMTAVYEFFMSELKIQEMIDKLTKMSKLDKIFEMTSTMATLTTAVSSLVTSGEALLEAIDALQVKSGALTTAEQNVLNEIIALLKKVKEDEFELATAEDEKDASYEEFLTTYSEDLNKVKSAVATLKSSLSDIGSQLDALPGQIEAFNGALDDAKTALAKLQQQSAEMAAGTSGDEDLADADGAEKAATQVKNPMELIIDAMQTVVNNMANDFKQEMVDEIKSKASALVADLTSDFYDSYGSLFTTPLRDGVKDLIDDFLAMIPDTWDDASQIQLREDIRTAYITQTLNVLDFGVMVGTLQGQLDSAMVNAKESIEGSFNETMSTLFTDLVKAIENLFNLDLFYNSDLNAFLSDDVANQLVSSSGNQTENSGQLLLNAISGLFSAADNFKEAVSGDWIKLLSAVADLFTAFRDAITALTTKIEEMFSKMEQVIGYFSGEGDLYDLMLIASYMTYMLPNRTCKLTGTMQGSALTGYPYASIPFPDAATSGLLPETGLQGLVDFFGELTNGGSDDMFRGAELEYIMKGTQSEVINQVLTFFDVYFIRMILDIVPILLDPNVATMAATFNIASWVIYILVILGEPLCDTVLLVNGISVPIIKKSSYMTPVGLVELAKLLAENSPIMSSLGSFGEVATEGTFSQPSDLLSINYRTYCLIILLFTATEEDMLKRFADIVQLEGTRYYQNNGGLTFDINKTYTSLQTASTVTFDSLFGFIDLTDTSVFTRTITRDRGY